jgi:hypothetical protein
MFLRLVRYGLPFVVTLAGLLVMVLAPFNTGFEGGAAIVGAGLSILLLNLLHRAGVDGDRARDAEEDARRFYDAHGYWPDEARRAARS